MPDGVGMCGRSPPGRTPRCDRRERGPERRGTPEDGPTPFPVGGPRSVGKVGKGRCMFSRTGEVIDLVMAGEVLKDSVLL